MSGLTTTVASQLITEFVERQMLKKFAIKIALSTATVSENYCIFFFSPNLDLVSHYRDVLVYLHA